MNLPLETPDDWWNRSWYELWLASAEPPPPPTEPPPVPLFGYEPVPE